MNGSSSPDPEDPSIELAEVPYPETELLGLLRWWQGNSYSQKGNYQAGGSKGMGKKLLLYTYKFSRDVNFADLAVSWPSANFSSLKIHNV